MKSVVRSYRRLRMRLRQWFFRTLLKFLRWTHDRWPAPGPHIACPFCKPCPECDGMGTDPATLDEAPFTMPCRECNGSGRVPHGSKT